MSTILKALQRLEDEKSSNVERSLSEQVVARRPPRDPERRRGLRIGAVAIGGLAVAGAAFFFWTTREESDATLAMDSPPPATVPAPAQEVAVEKPRRKPSARPAPAARAQQDSPEVEVSPVVEVVKRLDAPPADSAVVAVPPKRTALPARAGAERPARRPSARKPAAPVARVAAQPRPAPKQVANAKTPEAQISGNSVSAQPVPKPPAAVETEAVAPKPVSKPPVAVETAAVAPKPVPKPPAAVEIAAVAPKPAPAAASASIPAAIREPDQQVVRRAKVPALSIEKTIWHPDADRRVAVVKLVDAEEVLSLKEGDAVGPLVVKAITPASVLFDHDGIEIQINVGG